MKLPIYCISDNHFLLENNLDEMKRRQKLFSLFHYIKKTGGTLIIGGDFFDFWLETNYGIPNYYNNILDELEILYQNNINIHYVMGNHDYWDFGFFKKKFGCVVHKKDFLFNVDNQKILITHGDGVLKHDYMYRFMKNIIRSKPFIFMIRLIPSSILTILAKKISKTKKKFGKNSILDTNYKNELRQFAFNKIKNDKLNTLLMGHYHQLGIENKNNQYFIHLGDWINNYTVTILDKQGKWTQKKWKL